MSDLISRQAAIDNLERYRELFSWDDGDRERAILSRVIKELQSMPTADFSEYCDKLWKTAYERGKAEAHPKKGKWINHRNDEGHNIADCDQCGEAMQWFDDDIKPNYCPNCGARMEESE